MTSEPIQPPSRAAFTPAARPSDVDDPASFLCSPLRRGQSLPAPSQAPLAFHRDLPDYAPTPLRPAPVLAESWGVGAVWLKLEAERLGLPSYKIVGALWAAHRLLCERLGLSPEQTRFEQLRARLHGSDLGLLTASAGNWGRAVARVARLLALRSVILVPADTVPDRVRAIKSEGATVELVDGSFDETVNAGGERASERDLLFADTSSPGYEHVPAWVTEGYETLLAEVDAALADASAGPPDLVVTPIGVGTFAAAVARHYRADHAPGSIRLLGVEPHGAACLMASTRTGRIVTVPGSTNTAMVGMNCGTPSPVAWPDVSRGFDAFCAIPDAVAEDGMRALATLGIAAGACSGGVVGATRELLTSAGATARECLALDSDSSLVLLVTEGVTDPEHYRSIVEGPHRSSDLSGTTDVDSR